MSWNRAGAVACLVAVATALVPVSTARAAEHTYKTEHFALTWSDDVVDRGGDADAVPIGVVRAGEAFERARSIEVDELGFRAPPVRGRYDVYVSAAESQGFTRVAPGGNGRSRPSFIVMPPSLVKTSARTGDVRAFAGHEYFHAIQLGYDASEEPWIMEATAAWMEGIVAPGSHHQFAYLPPFVLHPELGMYSRVDLHEYGAFLFFELISERYLGGRRAGADLVRRLWEDMAAPEAVPGSPDYDAATALATDLPAAGIDVADAWRELLLWAWQLGRFEDGAGYRRTMRLEGWPSAPTHRVVTETCRLTPDAPDGVMPALSGAYERFLPPRGDTRAATLDVEGPPGSVALALIAPASRGPSDVVPLEFGDDGVATTTVAFGGSGARRVTLATGNGSVLDAAAPLAYSLRVVGGSATTATAPSLPADTIYGTGVSIGGRVECGGEPAPFAHVVLRQTESASTATHEVELVTDQYGAWSYVTTPAVNSTYSVRVADPLLSGAQSAASPIAVHVAVNMSLSADQIAEGDAITVSGSVAPVHYGRIVVERRRPNGVWETAAETATATDGSYSVSFTFPAPGLWEVRARMPDTGDSDHAPGDSAPKPVQVGET